MPVTPALNPRICGHCGIHNDQTTRRCTECGAPLPVPSPVPQVARDSGERDDDEPLVPAVTAPPRKKKYAFGVAGLIIGLFGLAVAICQPAIVQRIDPPPPKQTTSDHAAEFVERVAVRLLDKAKDKTTAPATVPAAAGPSPWKTYVSVGAAFLGFLSGVFGLIGWLRKEYLRLAVTTMIVGLIVVAWSYVLPGLTIAVAIVAVTLFLIAITAVFS